MSVRDEISLRSTWAGRIVLWGCLLEGIIRLGIWLTRWSWLRNVEPVVLAGMLSLFALNCLEFRILQMIQAANEEMQEYVDKRFKVARKRALDYDPDLDDYYDSDCDADEDSED